VKIVPRRFTADVFCLPTTRNALFKKHKNNVPHRSTAEFVAPLRSTGGATLGFFVTQGALLHAMLVYQPWRKWAAD
jgi:hypothetical protein